jgi:hypothetical protein
VVFLRRPHVLFMLQLDPTPQIKKIGDIFSMKHGFDTVYPYAATPTPAFFSPSNITSIIKL